MINLKDALNARKTITENSQNNKYSGVSNYCNNVGTKVSTGLVALMALVVFVTNIINFLSDGKNSNNDRRSRR